MSDLDTQLKADRAMRNAAKRLVGNDLRALQNTVPPRDAIGFVKDEAHHITALAKANPQRTATIGAVIVGLLLAWMLRGRLADLFFGSDEEDDPEDEPADDPEPAASAKGYEAELQHDYRD